MSASDVRRGPGWWMDLEGGWNPPDTWPDASPPLPGWTQSDDGQWVSPTAAELAPNDADSAIAEVADSTEVERPRLGLTYAERTSGAPVTPRLHHPSLRSAVMAAIAAAVIAAMIATGLIVLASLL